MAGGKTPKVRRRLYKMAQGKIGGNGTDADKARQAVLPALRVHRQGRAYRQSGSNNGSGPWDKQCGDLLRNAAGRHYHREKSHRFPYRARPNGA